MKHYSLIIAITVAFCVACGSAPKNEASEERDSDEPRTVSVDEFLDFIDYLEVAVESGNTRDMTLAEIRDFERVSDRLRTLLDGVGEISDMRMERRVEVFNLQQELDGLMRGSREDYLICRREPRLGSRLSETQCMSAGDYWRRNEENRRQFGGLQRPGPMPGPGG